MPEVQPNVELFWITPDAEKVIEKAGRVAWRSQNKQTEESYEVFIKRLISMGHESVLEHASASVIWSGISRACSHQLVRHRLVSYTQESQRYCNMADFDYIIPPTIKEAGLKREFELSMAAIADDYMELLEGIKLVKTSGKAEEDARYVLPNACATKIVITTNLRQWRHMNELRLDTHAQWEIRRIMMMTIKLLQPIVPTAFCDFVLHEDYAEKVKI